MMNRMIDLFGSDKIKSDVVDLLEEFDRLSLDPVVTNQNNQELQRLAPRVREALHGIIRNATEDLQVSELVEILQTLEAYHDRVTSLDERVQLLRKSVSYQVVYQGYSCLVEVKAGRMGTFDVRFTLVDSQENACRELNDAIKQAQNFPEELGWEARLNEDVSEICDQSSGNDVTTFTPLVPFGGKFLDMPSESTRGNKEDLRPFLKDRNAVGVNGNIVTLACAAYRVYVGFPEDVYTIGTRGDSGDLLEGYLSYTSHDHLRAGFRTVTSCLNGVGEAYFGPHGGRRYPWRGMAMTPTAQGN